MTAFVSTTSLDAKLNDVASSNEYHACTGDPTDRAQVIANSLGFVVPSFGSLADDGSGGRDLPINALATPITSTGAGTVATVCLITATELKLKTDLQTPKIVALNDPIDLSAWVFNASAAELI